MAEDSEVEGDEDADDCLPVSINNSVDSEDAEPGPSHRCDDKQIENEVEEDEKVNEESESTDDEDVLNWSKNGKVPQQFSSTSFSEPFRLSYNAEVEVNSPVKIFKQFLPITFLEFTVLRLIYMLHSNIMN